ncbi:hypothetical protein Tco_0889520 [Tanacetum coccineum]
MDISIADQIALDDALVAPADRLKIGKCNLRLSSDVTSKEATLQVVYDVLKLTPFYKAFQINSTRYIASLGHSGDIRKITDVNVNKLHQPWRSFAAIINKCLSGKPSYDSLRLSKAQILWGMYNKKNVDYAYLLWEDFIFKMRTKYEEGNAMYLSSVHQKMTQCSLQINVISRNEVTQLYGAILPVGIKPTRNIPPTRIYKEYYAFGFCTIPPKTKGKQEERLIQINPKLKPHCPNRKEVWKRKTEDYRIGDHL